MPVREEVVLPPQPLTTPTVTIMTNTPTIVPTVEKVITTPTESVKNNSYSLSDVSKHNTRSDCWIIIKNNVYAVTSFLSIHPGGAGEIIPYCGKDATSAFQEMEKHDSRARDSLLTLLIGSIK